MMTTTCDEEKGWAENSLSGRWTLLCSTKPASMMILDDIFFSFYFLQRSRTQSDSILKEEGNVVLSANRLGDHFHGKFLSARDTTMPFSPEPSLTKRNLMNRPRHEAETRDALNFNKQISYARCCQARLVSLCRVICIKKDFYVHSPSGFSTAGVLLLFAWLLCIKMEESVVTWREISPAKKKLRVTQKLFFKMFV